MLVSGDVPSPITITGEQLRTLPSYTQGAAFDSSRGPQQHTYVGSRLIDVMNTAGALGDSDEHTQLAAAVVAVGADRYTAAVAWGEISPDFAVSPVLVAYTQDGVDLERPRLVVPGDVKGGRFVADLTELRLVKLG